MPDATNVTLSPDHPFDAPGWNPQDQSYLCDMVGYGFPVAKVREPFRYIIEQGRCATWPAEYEAYLARTRGK